MNTQKEFPDLIKAGLKVGDTVYSYIFREGKVVDIPNDMRIVVEFPNRTLSFDNKGFHDVRDAIPTIHLTPWNPIAGEPFPFPKWEPVVGQVYAFWNNQKSRLFYVSVLTGESDAGYFVADKVHLFDHCAPIAEAMHIFGFDKPQQL